MTINTEVKWLANQTIVLNSHFRSFHFVNARFDLCTFVYWNQMLQQPQFQSVVIVRQRKKGKKAFDFKDLCCINLKRSDWHKVEIRSIYWLSLCLNACYVSNVTISSNTQSLLLHITKSRIEATKPRSPLKNWDLKWGFPDRYLSNSEVYITCTSMQYWYLCIIRYMQCIAGSIVHACGRSLWTVLLDC